MKKTALSLIFCVLLTLSLSGCKKYDNLKSELANITIDNIMEEIEEEPGYKYLSEIDDIVYREQLAACQMFTEAYNKTYYQNLAVEGQKKGNVAKLCNRRRKEIFSDIQNEYARNIYRLLRDVEDCNNVDAYVLKTYSDVLDFYDVFDEYLNGDSDEALLSMILEYSQRSNILALTFLDDVKSEVCSAALDKIEENASNDEDLRLYVNLNNEIITALNTLYGTIPSHYAMEISEVNTDLAEKLLLSLETISDKDKNDLLAQLRPTPEPTSTPTPSPVPTRTPSPAPTHTPRPTTPPSTIRPTTPAPTTTRAPSATARPSATAAPTDPPISFEIDDEGYEEFE